MIKIRLSRSGKKHSPFYRVVACDERVRINGKVLEVIGTWNPSKKEFVFDKKKYESWIKRGAQPSGGLKKLLNKEK